ncbi:DAK2 domain-containing protein [Dellaglioa algida]|uniref:DhaL domain-containing protein n=1 Tax=Dellaglioa algida TaxID=105612 RepID=A0A5C6M9H2_9LACO|nr:DAK2 domain-containing protein [Dellaglioa algida]MDK1716774.1 DAK2 domain-containing protein [Dellaglioa algida]MDK1720553.1 DAK2 domain-containing protein [Dellaglioa algida]MDK1721716.1 DAK2 domain-containing protein [Dellaglioa algida]MDK1723665.1 DAK2 domain-containing protein [Dellaglioa algida]MDK1725244.1 DAK2 domain-containing protein [Dellaglioa algida]
MTVTEITDQEFRQMVQISSQRLAKNAEFINSLNVFPVPDGDTGTNMNLSFASGAKYVQDSPSEHVGELSSILAKGLLMGARGNSGVILSQIFRGFYKRIESKEVLTAADLADALTGGVEVAYKAVMKPTEGTILTVAREAAKAANKAVSESDDVIVVMAATYEAAKKALATTPDLLPVLKEVGVVDSGGQGLTFVYEGFYDALTGKETVSEEYKPNEKEMDEMVNASHHQSVQSQLSTEDIQFGYCTEIMLKLGAGRLVDQKFDYDEFRNHLSEIGDSLLVVADDEVVKVHVHTENPGEVMTYGQHYGSLIKVKVDNMRQQHETILENDEEGAEAVDASVEPSEIAVISISSGAGVATLFKSLGVSYILSGGQTMNPSTEDIVKAIEATKAKNVIILPNNKNIFLAAEQAVEVSAVPAVVVPSRTIAQGMTAMLGFNIDSTLEENKEVMIENLDTVTSGQVTIAVRDTTIEGVEIKKDNYMGIIDGSIKVTDNDRKKVAIEMTKEMLDEDSEIITIIVGEDGSEAEAKEIEAAIYEIDEDLEVEIHEGNQPVYPYLISVE